MGLLLTLLAVVAIAGMLYAVVALICRASIRGFGEMEEE